MKRTMKVLMTLGRYEFGGFATTVNFLSRYLRHLGVDVTIAAMKIRESIPYSDVHELKPVEICNEAKHYDVVHVHISFPYLYYLEKCSVKNFLLTHHGVAPLKAIPQIREKFINFFLNNVAYKFLLKNVPIIISNSYHTKEKLYKLYKINSVVIYNGVDLNIFKPNLNNRPDSAKEIIFFNPTAWKSPNRLVKHFFIIKQVFKTAKLLAIGLPQKYWHGQGIIALPRMPLEKVAELYRRSHILLFVSEYESFGYPIVEAFASGVPVVALYREDARIEHLLNSRGGLFYDERMSSSLIKVVSTILENYNYFRRQALQYAQNFNWLKIALKYKKIYEIMLNILDTKRYNA